jgi:hypothetical protein
MRHDSGQLLRILGSVMIDINDDRVRDAPVAALGPRSDVVVGVVA